MRNYSSDLEAASVTGNSILNRIIFVTVFLAGKTAVLFEHSKANVSKGRSRNQAAFTKRLVAAFPL